MTTDNRRTAADYSREHAKRHATYSPTTAQHIGICRVALDA